MGKVLKADCNGGDAYVTKNLSLAAPWTIQCDLYIPATTLAAIGTDSTVTAVFFTPENGDLFHIDGVQVFSTPDLSAGPFQYTTSTGGGGSPAGSFTPDTWIRSVVVTYDGSDNISYAVHGSTLFTYNEPSVHFGMSFDPVGGIYVGGLLSDGVAGEVYYIDNVKVFDSSNSLVFSDDFESGGLTNWDVTTGGVSVVDDPAIPDPDGRVLIAFTNGPLDATPSWTVIDQGGDFPENFVSGYDTSNGRQTLISQTDTGTATVYLNDREGLFDPRNSSSPYFGELDGRQIMLQLYDPVSAVWEPQFQGWIDEAAYVLDGSAVDANGDPINATIQLNCVDMFDFLGGYGLTPGLDGVTPPSGSEDSVYYAATSGTVDDRIIEILTDVGIDSTRYIVASGNVRVVETKYDPDEAALTALRDAADAELPFIANIYINRSGQFVFRGRYSRFDPDTVAAEPGSEWDFTRWGVGDQKAITGDATRAQMRVLEYNRSRQNILNAAICYPQGLDAKKMPDQVYADTTSITDYGKHAAQPLSDLITGTPVTSGATHNYEECQKYAELLVKNQKDPREAITSLQVKSIDTSDGRASATWGFITRSDVSHIVNVKVGYPGGTGFTGAATADDYYIEGRALTVRPANTGYDYVEYDVEVSPAIWSMDTHSVFPPLGA